MFSYSSVPSNSPCVKTCPNRTVTCKFDGSCSGYADWHLKHAEEVRLCNIKKYAENQINTQCKYTKKRKSPASTRANIGGGK